MNTTNKQALSQSALTASSSTTVSCATTNSKRRCGQCGQQGHDRRTCSKVDRNTPAATAATAQGGGRTTYARQPARKPWSALPSSIRLTEEERDELLGLSFSTGIVFEYASRVAKAIRSALAAAALENNYDPLVALKVVLAAGPPIRRGSLLKSRLDAYLSGDVPGLIEAARKLTPPPRSAPRLRPRPLEVSKPHAAAMAALAAGRPGRALRRLSGAELVSPTEDAATELRKLHPVAAAPSLSDEAPDVPP